MSRRKLFIGIGVIAILATVFLSLGAAPSDMPRQGRPEQPQSGYARAPIYFNAVATPIRPDETHKASPAAVSAPFTPANIQQAYSFVSSAQGAGKVIAIIDAYGDPNLAKDVATFDNYFGLGSITPQVIYPDGQPRGKNSNWAIETALDVEWAHANAPAATIDVVVAPDSSLGHLLDAINTAAKITKVAAISMSWGAPESQWSSSVISQYESAFVNITGKGIVLLAASGDQGATDGTRSLTTDYPASSPEVIGVGGTTLTVNSSSGAYVSETAWSGSGGGYSAKFSEPPYQSTASISDPTIKRGVPDVAFDANPNTGVYAYCSPYWYEVGGTSVGAPNWAAIVADSAATSKALNLGYLYDTVYTSTTLYLHEIHDITSGNNGSPGYSAGIGWDAVTGIGTPIVSNLISGS